MVRSEDFAEGFDAFAHKRPPSFNGRRARDMITPSELQRAHDIANHVKNLIDCVVVANESDKRLGHGPSEELVWS
jgi:hypothetical protein